jgi:hypothetical protein
MRPPNDIHSCEAEFGSGMCVSISWLSFIRPSEAAFHAMALRSG